MLADTLRDIGLVLIGVFVTLLVEACLAGALVRRFLGGR